MPRRPEGRGSQRKVSRDMKLPSLPARAKPRNPGQPGSHPGLWLGTDLERCGKSKTGNLIKDTTLKADKLTGIDVGEKIPLTIETVNFKRVTGKLDGAEFVFVEGSDVAKIENGELVFTKEGSASVFAKATKVTKPFYSQLWH